MSEHLDKAKGALDHASDIVEERGHDTLVRDLLDIAIVQATVAQAEAMESMAASLEKIANPTQYVISGDPRPGGGGAGWQGWQGRGAGGAGGGAGGRGGNLGGGIPVGKVR